MCIHRFPLIKTRSVNIVRQSDPKIKNKINSKNRIDECLMLFLLPSLRLFFFLLYRIVPSLTRQQHLLAIRNKSDANNSKRRMRIDSPSLSHTSRLCVCGGFFPFRSLGKFLMLFAAAVVCLIILRNVFSCAWLLMIQKIIRWVLIYIRCLFRYLLAWRRC